MQPSKLTVTPIRRRLDYKAAIGIVKQSSSGGKIIQIRSHHPLDDSLESESQDSELSDDYTLEEDESTEAVSNYDQTEEEFRRKGMNYVSRYSQEKFGDSKSTPFSIRDEITRPDRVLVSNMNHQNVA